MRLARIGLGMLMAAGALAMPAPAQAQEQGSCFQDTGTALDGKCVPITADEYGNVCIGRNGICLPTGEGGGDLCVRQYCVTGVEENVNALLELIGDRVPDPPGLGDVLPVCTPNLLSGPICVG